MREEGRHPAPRGTILVAEGDSATPGTARGQVSAASAASGSPVPAVNGPATPPSEAAPAGEADRASEAAPATPGASPATPQPADAAAESQAGPAEERQPDQAGPAPTPPAGAPAASSAPPASSGPPAADPDALTGEIAIRPESPVEIARRAPAAGAAEPSWGRVLATTITLWTSRRLGRLTGRGRSGGGPAAITTGRRRSGIRWPLVAFVLVLVIAALVGLQLSGALSQHSQGSGTASGTTSGRSGTSGTSGNGGNGALSAAAAARASAATWIAEQVTASDLISCDPLMCSALQADGVAASRLMTIQPTSTDPLGADVVAATSSVRSQFGSALVSEYAPQLLASFGTGASRVDVRAVANFGAAAFQASEQADLAARRSAGQQLLRRGLLPIGDQGAGQVRSGQVDSRLLTTLAALLSQRAVDVSSFGDTGPGAPILYRQVTIVDAPGQTGTGALDADLRQAQEQTGSYRPARAAIVHLANGQSALRIEFGAPEPPGLLSGNS